jgi:hypothetical protein
MMFCFIQLISDLNCGSFDDFGIVEDGVQLGSLGTTATNTAPSD